MNPKQFFRFRIQLILTLLLVGGVAAKHSLAEESANSLLNQNTVSMIRIETKSLLPATLKALNVSETVQLALGSCRGQTAYLLVDLPSGANQPFLRVASLAGPQSETDRFESAWKKIGFVKLAPRNGFACVGKSMSDNCVEASSSSKDLAVDVARWNRTGTPTTPISVSIVLPEYVRDVLTELNPAMPKELGSGKVQEWVEAVSWMQFGFVPGSNQVSATVACTSNEAAQNLSAKLAKSMQIDSNSIGKPVQSTANESLLRWQGKIPDSIMKSLSDSLSPLIGSMNAQVKLDQFRKIILAVHNFESAYRILPGNRVQNSKTPDEGTKLSWRVHILPFLGNGYVDLYKEFRLNEAWDSPHNIQLLAKIPKEYQGTIDESTPLPDGHTCTLAPSGPKGLLTSAKPLTFSKIADGSSNTVIIVEVHPKFSRPWTAPDDYVYDPKDPLAGLVIVKTQESQWIAGLGDGSTMLLPASLKPNDVVGLFTIDGGEVVRW